MLIVNDGIGKEMEMFLLPFLFYAVTTELLRETVEKFKTFVRIKDFKAEIEYGTSSI